jgi:hypothetical protein
MKMGRGRSWGEEARPLVSSARALLGRRAVARADATAPSRFRAPRGYVRGAGLRLDLDDSALETLAEQISERLTPLPEASPWMDFAALVEYTSIPAGTLRKMTASGLIPAHGGRTKIYHRDEVDAALRRPAGTRGARGFGGGS